MKAAVMAALLDGQTLRHIEREHGVPKSTVERWGREADMLMGGVPSVPDKKKEQIGGLLIDLLVAKLEAQIAMAKHSGDKNWLAKQDASAFAMLLGVSDDKLMRLLEKFESGNDVGNTDRSAQN